MKKGRVTNLTPYDADVRIYDGGFVLTFTGLMEKDDSRKNVVHVRLDNWFVGVLAQMLWKVVRYQESQIAIDKKCLKGE